MLEDRERTFDSPTDKLLMSVTAIAPNTPKTKLPHPMPIAITFFAGQGEEPTLIKIGTAYESATHHRTPPPAFGPAPAQLGRTTSSR